MTSFKRVYEWLCVYTSPKTHLFVGLRSPFMISVYNFIRKWERTQPCFELNTKQRPHSSLKKVSLNTPLESFPCDGFLCYSCFWVGEGKVVGGGGGMYDKISFPIFSYRLKGKCCLLIKVHVIRERDVIHEQSDKSRHPPLHENE